LFRSTAILATSGDKAVGTGTAVYGPHRYLSLKGSVSLSGGDMRNTLRIIDIST
jgi:hypothetical protein